MPGCESARHRSGRRLTPIAGRALQPSLGPPAEGTVGTACAVAPRGTQEPLLGATRLEGGEPATSRPVGRPPRE